MAEDVVEFTFALPDGAPDRRIVFFSNSDCAFAECLHANAWGAHPEWGLLNAVEGENINVLTQDDANQAPQTTTWAELQQHQRAAVIGQLREGGRRVRDIQNGEANPCGHQTTESFTVSH